MVNLLQNKKIYGIKLIWGQKEPQKLLSTLMSQM